MSRISQLVARFIHHQALKRYIRGVPSDKEGAMNRNQGWLILIGSALLALPFAVWSQTGSTTTTDTKTTPESTDRLIQKYTAFAGSEDNAKSLVTGLRSGTEVKLS